MELLTPICPCHPISQDLTILLPIHPMLILLKSIVKTGVVHWVIPLPLPKLLMIQEVISCHQKRVFMILMKGEQLIMATITNNLSPQFCKNTHLTIMIPFNRLGFLNHRAGLRPQSTPCHRRCYRLPKSTLGVHVSIFQILDC